MVKKQFGIGIGTIFSLIVVYFIYLYSRSQNWNMLAFVSKWYLIIVGGFIALSISIILLVMIFSLLMFIFAAIKLRGFRKKARKDRAYVDIDYEIKE